MAILDEIKAEVESELSQQPQEEKPKSILDEVTQEVTQELYQKPELFTETQQPKEDFFDVAEKALEPVPTAAEKTSGDIFLNVISQKRSNELDDEDKSLFNSLSDDEQYKVAQARKDIPLDDAQARRIFDVEKSKIPSIPSSWEDWYNLGGDAVDVIKGVSKIPVKVGLGAAEFGRDVVKATDMTVSDEEAAKNLQKAKGSFYSFMAPAFEIPEDVIWMGEKAKEGGFGWADAVGEKMGLVNPEDRFERWKGRRIVDQAHAEYFREHPTIYGRLLDSPLAKDALTYISKSQMESPEELAARTNVSVEQAKAQQDEMARGIVDELTSEMESELPEENASVRIAGEFLLPGEVGMGTMGAVSLGYKGAKNIAQGFKYIGKSADEIAEINKSAQVLQKLNLDEMLKKRTERATSVAKGAEKIEEVIQRFKPIAEKTTGVLGKIAYPTVGGIAGYQMSPENPLAGILTGAVGGVAARSALKGIKFGLEVPTLVKEVAEARKVAPLGKTFETLGKSAEGSALKAKLLSRGGKTIDNILSNSVEYAKTGIHGTTLALATGALESASPEEMKQMLSDGLAITLGGRALQHIKGKFMGVDPVIAQRERISDDSRIRRRYQEADPETQANIDQISDFDNAIAFRQSKLDESQNALNEAIASNKSEEIKVAQENLNLQKRQLDATKRANVQTRNEFGREFLKTYANLQDITNGVLKSGQNNVGFNILSTDQIYQKLRNNPAHSNVPDADLAQMAAQAGFYSNPAQEGVVFDRKKPSIVLNADSIRERIKLFGETPMEALVHESSHFMDVVPEFQDALGGVRSMLFQNDIRDAAGNIKATTPGIFSKAKLTELFNDGYLRHLNPEGKEAFAKLNKLWDESRGQFDENKVADYMKSEVMADLLGEITSRHLAKDLDSATLAMWDRARIKAKKNLLDRAINRFYGLGGSGDIVTAANTRAEFPPEAMAAARDAMRQIVALNGEISPPVEAPQMPKISKAQMMKNSALIERFGKDSPLFKTEFKLKIFDKDGNQIGESMPVTTPNPLEGTFQNTDGGFKKLSGYGDIPVEAQGLQVPEGGTLVVSRDLAMEPDGVTPIMYNAKDAKKLAEDRRKLITESLDTDDYGTPNRFEAVSEDSETYRGTFTPAQIQAIKDMPESLIPKTLKENMLKMNDAIARGDGSRFIVDYAAVMNDNGKYQAFSPKMYDLVPIGMHLSKKGNFLVTTISVGRIFDKMRLWNERMPGRLRYWDNNLERTFDDFTKYLNNWQRGEAGETGLDADPQVALQKKNIFNDLLSLYDKATEYTNVDRTTIPRRKGDPRGKDANRTIMSVRVDHIAELLENPNATKMPVNYGFAKANFMPERMEGEVPRQEERQIDENVKFANPPSEKSAIDALSSNKREYFGMHRGLDDGYPVGIRIDIPAFTSKGVYVVTVHEKKKGGERGQVGERIGYDTIAKVDNPIFFSNEVGAKKIKSGEANKFPVATVEGQFNSSREIPEDINEWTPVGYNPREHSYFYDKTNDEPVLSGDEAISVGNTVFVKNPVYGDKANFAFMPERPVDQVAAEQGFNVKAYHGTSRADRVGNRFRKTRATSGPMAFFTSDPNIAENYSKGKADTSIEPPEDYRDWFKVKPAGSKKEVNISDAWYSLTPEQKRIATERLYTTGYEDADQGTGKIIPNAEYSIAGKDSIDYELRKARGNAFEAAKEIWLTSGSLYNSEIEFKDVLKSLGVDARFDDPFAKNPKVYDVFLKIQNPLVTSEIPENVIEALRENAKKQRKPTRQFGADAWDKRTVDAKDWISELDADYAAGKNSFAWTRIPDWVTETLKTFGYDSIQDTGGKMGGEGHDVYIPFEENQIKSAAQETFTDAGKKIPMEKRFSEKPDIRFMPERPVGKTQAGYDYSYLDQALASGKEGRVALTRPVRADEALPLISQRIPITEEVEKDLFDYTRPAEVVFYQHENKPVSFKFDPELIEKPVFKDAAIEHAGKNVQLAMADRQTATGGDMGGIIFPWLKSNANAIITGDDGINYRAVWANNEWKPVLSMRNKNINFNAFNLLTYLMGPDAHASNAREVRNISNEIENAQISREQKDLFLILANIGVKKQKRADQQKNIKSANDYIEETKKLIKESSDKEEIKKLNNEIKLKEKDIELAKIKYDRFLETSDEELIKPVITKYKTAYTRFKGGTGSENTFIKNKTALDEFKKTKSFKDLLKIIKNKQLISLDDTFKGRKASIAQILGLTIDNFNVDNVLDQTMDFKNGRTNHIVGSVELSRNSDLMAVYLGDDPKQAKRMTAQEAKAAAQLKADPNFVPHEAYSWVMLGPVDGNNFLNSNPKTHLEYFPDFQETYANIQEDAGKKQKILEGNETTLMGAMRDNTQMPLAMPTISDKK